MEDGAEVEVEVVDIVCMTVAEGRDREGTAPIAGLSLAEFRKDLPDNVLVITEIVESRDFLNI